MHWLNQIFIALTAASGPYRQIWYRHNKSFNLVTKIVRSLNGLFLINPETSLHKETPGKGDKIGCVKKFKGLVVS